MFSKNIEYGKPLKISAWRKIAIGTWKTVGDPSVYGALDLDCEQVLKFIEKKRAESGVKITLTHAVGKAIAHTIQKHPEINCVLRFGKLYPRKTVDVFFQVATDEKGEDLSGAVIRNADQKSIVDIARELEESARKIRTKEDQTYTKFKNMTKSLPGMFASTLLGIGGFILYKLNIWSPLLNSPKDAFGSIMVTSIGSLGMDEAYGPLVPYSHVPSVIAVGALTEKPVVRNGQIVIGKMIRVCATFDHRLIDGIHGSKMAKTMKAIFHSPEKYL